MMGPPIILAGDVGGTKTNLALCARQQEQLVALRQCSVSSRQAPSLEAILGEFLKGASETLSGACLGVAGPIVEGRCQATNLPWHVDARVLQRALGLPAVELINDLEATGYGLQTLPVESLTVLNAGEPALHGTIAVIAAGTGLGEGALVWTGARYQAVATEGGHTDFAPRNALEEELRRYLAAQFGHVSYERILSGPGKVSVYQFLRDTGRGEEPAWLTEALSVGDPSPVISEMASNGRSPLCVQALELFASIYGAEAGNLALKYFARGGVYLAGGIAPTILPFLQQHFLPAFIDKGRLAPLMQRMPVRVALEGRTALFGAAQRGFETLAGCRG